MSVPAHHFNIEKLRRFNGPEFFLGGGFVAGLLVFLVWLALLPDHGRHALRARNGADAAANGLAAPGKGVLSGITGESGRAVSGAQVSDDQGSDFGDEDTGDDAQLQAEADAAAEGGTDADNMAVGEDVGAAAQLEEGAALTDGLLGPQASAAGAAPATAPGAPLLPYYVEVEVAPGQVQVLQLNAESPEHARAILRDFRGDPRVLRGPTTEPLQ